MPFAVVERMLSGIIKHRKVFGAIPQRPIASSHNAGSPPGITAAITGRKAFSQYFNSSNIYLNSIKKR
jgi:hypothetical protein